MEKPLLRDQVLRNLVNFTTNLLYFGQSTTIHRILQSIIKTASVVPLRNKHNMRVVVFTTIRLNMQFSFHEYKKAEEKAINELKPTL